MRRGSSESGAGAGRGVRSRRQQGQPGGATCTALRFHPSSTAPQHATAVVPARRHAASTIASQRRAGAHTAAPSRVLRTHESPSVFRLITLCSTAHSAHPPGSQRAVTATAARAAATAQPSADGAHGEEGGEQCVGRAGGLHGGGGLGPHHCYCTGSWAHGR